MTPKQIFSTLGVLLYLAWTCYNLGPVLNIPVSDRSTVEDMSFILWIGITIIVGISFLIDFLAYMDRKKLWNKKLW